MQNLFQNIWLRGKGRKGLFFCRRETDHIFPCLLPKPDASGQPRSAKTPEGARVRASEGWALRGSPVWVRLLLTCLGREDPASACAATAALRLAPRHKSRPRGRAAEAAARTAQRTGRRPSLSAPREAVSGSRCCPLLLLFLSPSCNPTTPTSGSREARHSRWLHPLPGYTFFAAPQATLARKPYLRATQAPRRPPVRLPDPG